MTRTLTAIVEQVIAEQGARAVLNAVGEELEIPPEAVEAVLARTPVAAVLRGLAIEVEDGEDPEDLVREVLSELGHMPLPEGADEDIVEHLAACLLRAAVEDGDEDTVAEVFVRACGEQVVAKTWDGGGMCHSGVETVWRLGDSYWYLGAGGCLGPITSLREAVRDYLAELMWTTIAVDSDTLTAEELLDLFEVSESLDPGYEVAINEQRFVLNDERRWEHVPEEDA